MDIYLRFDDEKKPNKLINRVTNLNVRDGEIKEHPQFGEYGLLKLFLIRNGNYEEYDDVMDLEVL